MMVDLRVEVDRQMRPRHECKRFECDNYIYGPVVAGEVQTLEMYTCDECQEAYRAWSKNWPQSDVTFIIS